MSQFIFPPLTASLDSEQTNGGSLPAKQMVMAGFDSTATRALLTDSSGRLEINAVVSLPLPSGAATAALQTAGNNLLTTIDADTSLLSGAVKNIQSAQGTTDAGLPALVVRNDTLADLSGADGDYTPLQVNATGALYTAVHSSALPTGAATEAKQDTIEATLTAIETDLDTSAGAVKNIQSAQGTTDAGIPALVVRNDTLADLSGADGDYSPLQVNATGALYTVLSTGTASIGSVTLNANSGVDIGDVDVTSLPALPSGTNTIGKVDVNAIAPVDFLDSGLVDTSTANIESTGTTVVSSLEAACTEIEIQEDIGEFMSLRVGGTVKAFLPLGGGRVKVSLAATDAVQLFSETGGNISNGKIAINFLG